MTLRLNLIIGFLSLVAIFLLASLLTLKNDLEVHEELAGLVRVNIKEMRHSAEIAYQVQLVKSNLRELMLERPIAANPAADNMHASQELVLARQTVMQGAGSLTAMGQDWLRSIEEDLEEVGEDEGEGSKSEAEEREELLEAMELMEEFVDLVGQFITLYDQGATQQPAYEDLFEDEIEPVARELQAEIDELRAEAFEEAAEEGATFEQRLNANLEIALYALAGAILLSILFILFFLRRIMGPIDALGASVNNIRQGQMDTRVAVSSRDEIGLLATSFNHMIDTLQGNLEQLNRQRTELADARDQADTANKAKSDFLANISHEIRTPMNAILNFTDLARQVSHDPVTARYLARIDTSSHALLRIINDILDYSKIEAGQLDLNPAPFALWDLLQNLADMFRVQAAEKQIALVFDLADTGRFVVDGDELRLQQVLINLLGNALKFTETGTVTLSCRQQNRDGDAVRLQFQVQDTGIGMEPAYLEQLFKPFTQEENASTRQFGGTGLGLSISRQIVRMMGGDISVQSQPGKGSIFTFDILVHDSGDIVPAHMQALPAAHAGARVLLAEPDDAAAGAVMRMLTDMGLLPVQADSAETATFLATEALAKAEPFGLVLLADGMEALAPALTAQYREQNAAELPAYILLTGAYDDLRIEQGLDGSGIRHWLGKPVCYPALYDRIMACFGGDPAGHAAQDTGPDMPAIMAHLAGARILLVEDHVINREIVAEILGAAGVHLDQAVDGKQGVAMAGDNAYDAILMDVQMPVMDGFEATSHIRQLLNLPDVPIIAMTASAMLGDREKCLAVGMNDYVSKPLDRQRLFDVLMRYIQPRRQGGAAQAGAAAKAASMGLAGMDFQAIDVTAALARLNGNEALLARLLSDFADSYGTAGDRLRACLQDADKPDIATALLLLHTIKGLAGNLSANPLVQAVSALEHALQQPDMAAMPALLADMDTCLDQLHADIARLPQAGQGDAESVAPAVNRDVIAIQLQTFAELVARYDGRAEAVLAELTPLLSVDEDSRDYIARMQQAISVYDFDLTASILAEFQEIVQDKL